MAHQSFLAFFFPLAPEQGFLFFFLFHDARRDNKADQLQLRVNVHGIDFHVSVYSAGERIRDRGRKRAFWSHLVFLF